MDKAKFTNTVFRAVTGNRSMEYIIRKAHEMTGKPVIALDTAFRLYGYAFEHPCSYEPWEFISQERYLPDDFIYYNNSLKYQQALYDSRHSVYLDYGMTRDHPQVCAPILYNGRLCGYVGFLTEGSNDIDELLAANDILASALGICIGRKLKAESLDEPGLNMTELLNAIQINASQAERIKNRFRPPYITAVLCSEVPGAPTFSYIVRNLEMNRIEAVSDEGQEKQLGLLFYGSDAEGGEKRIKELMEGITGRYGLRCGVSDWFTDAALIPQSRMQAKLAEARMCGNVNGVSFFRDHFYELVLQSAGERYGRDICCLMEINNIVERFETAQDLLRTLDTYLMCSGNCSQAAEEMGLHKNTVYYRISRIKKELGDSMENPDEYVKLTVGILAEKYFGRGRKQRPAGQRRGQADGNKH